MPNQLLSTREIRVLFAEEISNAGGVISETIDDGDRLFTRSILPWISEVRPNDQMQGGVALKATERDVCLHPYLFRMVCRNGAIRAHAIQTRRLEFSEMFSPEEATAALRESVRACSVEEAFAEGVQEVRSAVETNVDLALTLLPFLSRHPVAGTQIFRQILSRFFEDPDPSRFALMNAVTSVARETRDPELRWRLEEFGGGLPVSRTPAPPLFPATATSHFEMENGLERSHGEVANEMLLGAHVP